MATATYTKLRNGDWGVRVQGTIGPGMEVIVTTRSGKTRRETVRKVLWRGNGICICTIDRGCKNDGLTEAYRHGWDGQIGSPSYYWSGAFDEIDA